jgi:colicin import membrane protein
MSIPVATALGRRDRSWPAILASAAVHAALVAWALTAASRPDIELQQRPIVAKLVRLGQKRPPELLPRRSAAEPPPAPAPAAAAKSPPAPAAPAAPAPRPTPSARPAPVAAKPPPPSPAPRASPAAHGAGTSQGSGASVASILAGARHAQVQERWGAPDGDPGGDADSAEEGDRYLAQVRRLLQANYRVPATLSERDQLHLEGSVVLYIEPDGRISRWRLERPSGNGAFDAALERTLGDTRRVPPPPDAFRERYHSGGVQVIFKILG